MTRDEALTMAREVTGLTLVSNGRKMTDAQIVVMCQAAYERGAADRIDADAERIKALETLLKKAAPLLEDYAEYANTAPIWHATGGTANALNPLVVEVNAAIARSKT